MAENAQYPRCFFIMSSTPLIKLGSKNQETLAKIRPEQLYKRAESAGTFLMRPLHEACHLLLANSPTAGRAERL
jgi:hypothetical protein